MRSNPCRPTRGPPGCRSSATRSRHGSSAGSGPGGSRHGGPADPRVEGARVLARAARARSARRARTWSSRRRPGTRSPSEARASPAARSCERRSTEDRLFLPDLDRVPGDVWARAAILWLNYPNNPTGAIAPRGFLEEAAERCRAHDVLLASDEAYSELWFGEGPPPGALQLSDRTNVLAINTLSKRSSMTGYRSGFVAGDPELIAALKRLRPAIGVTPQEFVQRASVAAWRDEGHVEENRARYAAEARAVPRCCSRGTACTSRGASATFYLWVAVPSARPSLAWALDLLDRAASWSRRGRSSDPRARGTCGWRWCPRVEACERPPSALDDLLAEVPA